MLKFAGILIFALMTALWTDMPAVCATRPAGAKIDLSKGLSFEKYLLTGDSSQMASAMDRASSLALSASFEAFVRGIDAPLMLVAYTELWCPDCARTTPFVRAIGEANPLVSTAYFQRDEAAKSFLRAQTGKASVPTIFATDENGDIVGDVYVEYPEKVRALIGASASDEEAARHRGDLRSGRYDEEIENGLRELIESALAEMKAR
jgi:glutaredoxin